MAEALLMAEDTSQAAKAQELLERALRIDPHSPKALFYSAVAAFRDGHLELARQRFQVMLDLGPPENIRTALQRQIDDIDAQLKGAKPDAAAAPDATSAPKSAAARGGMDAATAIHLHVTLKPSLAGEVPAAASLFVFVRAPGGGPPLAVKRLSASLPQDVNLSSADAMVAGRSYEAGQNVSVVARISASGSPLPQSGDLYGEIQAIAGKGGAQSLEIDRSNP